MKIIKGILPFNRRFVDGATFYMFIAGCLLFIIYGIPAVYSVEPKPIGPSEDTAIWYPYLSFYAGLILMAMMLIEKIRVGIWYIRFKKKYKAKDKRHHRTLQERIDAEANRE